MKKSGVVAGATWLVASACIVAQEPLGYGSCEQLHRECAVAYSSFTGYYRACNTVATPCDERANREDADEEAAEDEGSEGQHEAEASSPPSPPGPTELAAGPSAEPSDEEEEPSDEEAAPDRTRYSAFDIACARDNQCGPGKCLDGDCYYGCNSDEQCGSGDRCAVESGTRMCWPDPNPPVACTRSAQCDDGYACLNGSCRQSCTETEQCDNLLDRCASGVCVPDRRPLSECVLNSECSEGLVCLDGACVAACPAPAKDDVCLAEPEPSAAEPSEPEEEPAADAGASAPIGEIQ